MKRITLLFIAIIACLVTAAAQTDTATVQSSVTDTQIEYTDTPASSNSNRDADNFDRFFPSDSQFNSETVIAIIAIIAVFGLPVIIVFIAFYFKYKNRKEKYKLAEQALAAGQPIPEQFLQAKVEGSTLSKGITNIFTGIGLFIFLWAITNEFSIGCIGLLIMFTGFGQVVIHYTQNKKKSDYTDRYNNDNNTPIE